MKLLLVTLMAQDEVTIQPLSCSLLRFHCFNSNVTQLCVFLKLCCSLPASWLWCDEAVQSITPHSATYTQLDTVVWRHRQHSQGTLEEHPKRICSLGIVLPEEDRALHVTTRRCYVSR